MLENQLSRYGAISRVVPDLPVGGKLFLVSDSDDTTVGPSNLANEYPVDKDGVVRVYTTIQAAVNAAAGGRGDVVAVLPGFDFSLAGADSYVTAGVQIIGQGSGFSRPIIRYTAKTSEIGMSASNIRLSNLRFLAATDSIARAVDMDTGFKGQVLDNCVFDFDTSGNDFRVMLRMGSPHSKVTGNRFLAEDTAGTGKGISIKGGAPSFSQITDNFFYGQFDTLGDTSDRGAPIAQDTTDTADTNLSGLRISNNVVINTDTAAASYLQFSAGYRIRGIANDNRFVGYDSATADSSKFTYATAANSGLRSSRNYTVGDSGTEKLIGDSFIINV